MTPVEYAAAVYESEPCARTFKEDLEAHLLNGYVFSTPDYFVMGRAVDSKASYAEITNPWHVFESVDAWWVYLASGDLSQIILACPYGLPLIGFERLNKPRFYSANRITALLWKHSAPTSTLLSSAFKEG